MQDRMVDLEMRQWFIQSRNSSMCALQLHWVWPDTEVPETAIAEDVAEVRSHLKRVQKHARRRKAAISVSVVTPKKNVFSIVLGMTEGSIVTFDGNEGNPPYYVSLGDRLKDLEMVKYFFGGSPSELPASHVIPLDTAMNAIIDSIEREGLSQQIEWYGG